MPKAVLLCKVDNKEQYKMKFVRAGFFEILEKRFATGLFSLHIFYKTEEEFKNISKIIEENYA